MNNLEAETMIRKKVGHIRRPQKRLKASRSLIKCFLDRCPIYAHYCDNMSSVLQASIENSCLAIGIICQVYVLQASIEHLISFIFDLLSHEDTLHRHMSNMIYEYLLHYFLDRSRELYECNSSVY